MLSKRWWVGAVLAVLAVRLGAADVVAKSPQPSPLADGATALHWAAYRSDAESAAALIRAGANVNAKNKYGVTPLALAADQGSAALLDILLKAGAKPNDPINFVNTGETPLMHAARSSKIDAVKTLVRAGADVNAKENWNG